VISSKTDASPEQFWQVILHDEFESEFMKLDGEAQDALLAAAKSVRLAGPRTGRPFVDSLKGSRHANMKELRYKQGIDERRCYSRLVAITDRRFDAHLRQLAARR
jgi:hypothetical protein